MKKVSSTLIEAISGVRVFAISSLTVACILGVYLLISHPSSPHIKQTAFNPKPTSKLHTNNQSSQGPSQGLGTQLFSPSDNSQPPTSTNKQSTPQLATNNQPSTSSTNTPSTTSPSITPAATTTYNNYPMFMYDPEHNNYNATETAITTTTAPNLKQLWNVQVCPPNQTPFYKCGVSGQPTEYNNVLYWGSWDGNLHATNISTDKDIWATNLGVTTDSNCYPTQAGVGSTPTIRQISINGTQTPVVFVGGGDANVYALNANTGAVIWKSSLGMPPNTFIWSSPIAYNGYIYIGKSSFGDCPLVHAGLFQLNWTTGAIAHVFNTEPITPNNCTGSSIWGSPTIDRGKNTIYFATGNPGWCPNVSANTIANGVYGYAVVEVQVSDVSKLVGAWQVPPQSSTGDLDFGSTVTLFYAGSTPMAGVGSKGGSYYAFKRDGLGAGPVWTDQIAIGGDCPDCGNGTLSAAAWDGKYLYAAGGNTTINGQSVKGSVRAINPVNGSYVWQYATAKGPVLGAVSAIPGVVVVNEANNVDLINSATGARLGVLTPAGNMSVLDGPDMIVNGVLYFGDLNGNLYAYTP